MVSPNPSDDPFYSNLFDDMPLDDNNDVQIINRTDDPFGHEIDFGSPAISSSMLQKSPSVKNNASLSAPYQIEGLSTALPPASSSPEEILPSTDSSQQPLSLSIPALPPLPPLSEPVAFNPSLSYPSNNFVSSLSAYPLKQLQSSQQIKEKRNSRTRPAFVMKLWALVNDPANHEFIRWNADGKLIRVYRSDEFKTNVLPRYFKHNNLTLFVRQLNMYGWHKVQEVTAGSMLLEQKKENDELILFENENFIRGRPELLEQIVRNNKPEKPDFSNTNALSTEQSTLQLVLSEMEQIKLNQMALGEDLLRVRADSKNMWQESFIARERYNQQAQTLDRILNFLAAIYGNNSTGQLIDTRDVVRGRGHSSGVHHAGGSDSPLPSERFSSGFRSTNNGGPYNGKPRLMLTESGHDLGLIEEIIRSFSDGKTPEGQSPFANDKVEEISQAATPGDFSPPASATRSDPFNLPSADSAKNSSTGKKHLEQDLPAMNVNKMYQQLIDLNQDQGQLILSPRSLFPELHTDKPPSLPRRTQSKPMLPQETSDVIQNLEQNIIKQGQSIQHVQECIQKLARQQNPPNFLPLLPSLPPENALEEDFDVSQFLNGLGQSPSIAGTPAEVAPPLPTAEIRKSDFGPELAGDTKRRKV